MANQPQDNAPDISSADRDRIRKGTRLLAAYVNFLRWAGNFRRDEVTRHPRHGQVMMLSPLQSGRFAFAIEDQRLLLGAQAFEMAWLATMPFETAHVSDRLYLSTPGVQCLDVALPALTVGIFCDQREKREQMAACSHVDPVEIRVAAGRVADVGRPAGQGIPIMPGDVVAGLQAQAIQRQDRGNLSRFF